MKPSDLRFDAPVRAKLAAAMVSEEQLAEAICNEAPRPVPGEPGLVMCSLVVAVPRRSDPETAELRRVAVTMSDRDDSVEVIRLDGLRGRGRR